jgi:hypothetical protein
MLRANKNATMTDFQVKIFEIRQKELNYFVGLYGTMAGISSFFAGFAYHTLKATLPAGTHMVLVVLFLSVTCLSVGFEVCAISNSAFCCLFGPGMALRGPNGLKSMELAVNVLQERSEQTLAYLMYGLYGQIGSSMVLSWIKYDFFSAFIITCGLCLLLFLVHRYSTLIFAALLVKPSEAISGHISGAQVADPTKDLVKNLEAKKLGT